MSNIWQTIFYQPLFNLLVFIYNLVGGDMGIAIILLTIVLKIVLFPLSKQAIKSQKALQGLQPKIEALKVKFKDQKDVLAKEMMALYQTEKVSPASSCLPILIQLPFLIALYQVFTSSLGAANFSLLYPFVNNPGTLNDTFFGWHLAPRNIPLAVLTGLAQYYQSKMLIPTNTAIPQTNNISSAMSKQMLYLMPVMTVVIGFNLPGGLILFWFINTLLTIIQQQITIHHHAAPQTPTS